MTRTKNKSRASVASKGIRDSASFAQLVASERLTVNINPGAKGPSFNTATRVLTLPKWKTDQGVEDAMILHEVGHAIYTPGAEAEASVARLGSKIGDAEVAKWYVNVIEDARIDNIMIQQYPGGRADYKSAYAFFDEKGFFGIEPGQDLKALPFIDRINLHQKLGRFGTLDVPFTKDEALVIRDLNTNVRTFQDVVDMTERVLTMNPNPDSGSMASMLDFEMNGDFDDIEPEGQTKPGAEGADGAEGEPEGDGEAADGEGQGEGQGESSEADGEGQGQGEAADGDADGESSDGEGQGQGDAADGESSDGEGDDAGEGDKPSYGPEAGNTLKEKSVNGAIFDPKKAPMPKTAKALAASEGLLINTAGVFVNTFTVNIGKNPVDLKRATVHFTNFLNLPLSSIAYNCPPGGFENMANDLLKAFRLENGPIVSAMAQRFEQRKAADASKRVQVTKTGVIDTLKMNTYKWNDDIFRKNSTVKEGKSHGMVMVIDWSSSMNSELSGAINQALVLAEFCRKVRIPFEVYCFTDCSQYSYRSVQIGKNGFEFQANVPDGRGGVSVNAAQGNCYSCVLRQFLSNKMTTAQYTEGVRRLLLIGAKGAKGEMGLGGTPLNEAIVISRAVVQNFAKVNRVQMPHCVFLTDGEGGATLYPNATAPLDYSRGVEMIINDITHGYTARSHSDNPWISQSSYCHDLIRWASETSGATYTNFFINGRPSTMESKAEYAKDGICFEPSQGVEGWTRKYYIKIADRSAMASKFDAANSSVDSLLADSVKNINSKKRILTKFIEMIATGDEQPTGKAR